MEACARRSRDGVFARTALICTAFALFFGLAQLASARPLLDFAGDTGVPSCSIGGNGGQHVLTGSIALTDRTWVCSGPVHLASVTVTMTPAAGGRPPHGVDAIRLQAGVHRPESPAWIRHVTQSAGDGIKVADGVHDLTVYGGTVRCLWGRRPTLHQDGVQVMGGLAHHVSRTSTSTAGEPVDTLVNSNLFIRQAGKSLSPPTDVVCNHCSFGRRLGGPHGERPGARSASGVYRLDALHREVPEADPDGRPARSRPGRLGQHARHLLAARAVRYVSVP